MASYAMRQRLVTMFVGATAFFLVSMWVAWKMIQVADIAVRSQNALPQGTPAPAQGASDIASGWEKGMQEFQSQFTILKNQWQAQQSFAQYLNTNPPPTPAP
ncbi:hypothetical protein HZA86_04360 [Candidatus Uhrbacteria bacterium]|nr:hypothetical protein [Candidatus Uhrbacteria bacterium]